MSEAQNYAAYLKGAPVGNMDFRWSAPSQVAPHMATALDPTWLKISSFLATFDFKRYAAIGCLVGTMEAYAIQRYGWNPEKIAFFDLDIPEYNSLRNTGSYAYHNVCSTETSNFRGEFLYARVDSTKSSETILKNGPFDAMLLDGCHSQEALTRDLDTAMKSVRSGGVILIHDLDLPQTYLDQAYFRFICDRQLVAGKSHAEVRSPEIVHGLGIIINP